MYDSSKAMAEGLAEGLAEGKLGGAEGPKGYWFRKGRGWYVTVDENKYVPLRDEAGKHLKDPNQEREALAAYKRLTGKDDEALEPYLEKKRQMPSRNGGSKKRNRRGYWFRKGRGWFVTGPDHSKIPLTDEQGRFLKDRGQKKEAAEAYRRYLVDCKREELAQPVGVTVTECAKRFLDHLKDHGHPTTYKMRRRFIYDFVTGFPGRYAGSEKDPPESTRIHPGFANKLVADLTEADVQGWLDLHPRWKNTRAAVVSILRPFNYCKWQLKIIPVNPIAGFPRMKDGHRETYFEPEVEEAIYKYARPPLATAVRICIRTGARPVIEFGSLEARHVQETPQGQIWKFPKEEAKVKVKDRTIYVHEDIAKIVRTQMKRHPTGKLFRDGRGNPWTTSTLSQDFATLRAKLIKKGVPIDPKAVFYSCRHTFAKRMLGGYWGTQVSLEVLAGLMGNTPKICWEHYAQWCSKYVEPFWQAINRQGPGGQSTVAPAGASSLS